MQTNILWGTTVVANLNSSHGVNYAKAVGIYTGNDFSLSRSVCQASLNENMLHHRQYYHL